MNFERVSKELEDSWYISLYLHVNHTATAMYLIQAPHQLTTFTTIQASAVFNTLQATWPAANGKGAKKQSFLQQSLQSSDERLIRVYLDRISTQAQKSGHYYSAYPPLWWILCCLATGTKITPLTDLTDKTTLFII